jgi:2-hydroxychromene-2-carboxylate isomerase
MKEIEFWFSIGSTYTYLSVTRLKEVEQKFEVKFSWQPFSVRKIMLEMDNVPFPPTKQVKADYMWRDIERRASRYGFEAKVPAPYPLKEFDLANKIAVIGMQEGWCSDYVIATYQRWFVAGLEPGSEPNVSESLREIDQDPERVLELAADDNIRKAYLSQTEQAQSKRIFGSPSFIVDGELFWGDDRLEDAVNWALR